MAPIAIPDAQLEAELAALTEKVLSANIGKKSSIGFGFDAPPPSTLRRYHKYGVDLSQGYPFYLEPDTPEYHEAQKRAANPRDGRPYADPGLKADREKKALFGAAKSVNQLTKHIGTELVGIQLKDLNDQQKDELALLVAERGVVFFRDQDISPQAQLELGEYLGDGAVANSSTIASVPGTNGGVNIIWETARTYKRSFRLPWPEYDGYRGHGWHVDGLGRYIQAGYTHLHQDHVPDDSGDTLWASGYAAYDILSPGLKKVVDGITGIYTLGSEKDENGRTIPKFVHAPLVRTHPVTGWKSLYLSDRGLVGFEDWDKNESDHLLKYLIDVLQGSPEIQVRWKWTPGASAIWDQRNTVHAPVRDWEEERHGTRVLSLAAPAYHDPKSKSRGEALNIEGWLSPAWTGEAYIRSGYELPP
ncbi:hypothetical protein Q8F55_004806 [Vanrija albida]|uniref:TauD/TfdA-like domain-containing protein n=1 Tax=Vanrija albida TaxID=181172 RepID=A0ABR3PZU8_9TREE